MVHLRYHCGGILLPWTIIVFFLPVFLWWRSRFQAPHVSSVFSQQFIHDPFPPVRIRIPKSDPKLSMSVKDLSRKVYVLNFRGGIPFRVIVPYTTGHDNSTTFGLERVAIQSQHHHCRWAINGGPFHRDGSPAGSLIVGGRLVRDEFGESSAIGFGMTSSEYFFGRLIHRQQALGLVHYVAGFDWLVYKGKNVVNRTGNNLSPAVPRAPRTAVGVDSDGNLILVVADGCERCLVKQGPTLHEFADFLFQAGVHYAVNMDGGSSSTLVHHRTIVNHPTCLDVIGFRCTRRVASVICIP